jgi:hypothetical protein
MPSSRSTASPDYERIGQFIYGYQRLVGSYTVESAAVLQHGPRELADRVARLREEHGAILATLHAQDAVADERFDAALREAKAVGIALATWREQPAR